jgi:hypothetical protein
MQLTGTLMKKPVEHLEEIKLNEKLNTISVSHSSSRWMLY